KRDDVRHILRPGSPTGFVVGAVNQAVEFHAATHKKGADALRGIQLVTRDSKQVDPKVADVERDLSERLRRVGMQRHSAFAGDRGNFPNRLQCAYLVVAVHDGDQDGFSRDRFAYVVGIQAARTVDRKYRNRAAEPFQELARLRGRGVFDRAG